MVQWNEEVHEKQLIDRTKNACKGLVDIVIDFGTTSRSLHRSLQCLNSVSFVFFFGNDVVFICFLRVVSFWLVKMWPKDYCLNFLL